jgi:tetratricopeptide (TPR) repeat protein
MKKISLFFVFMMLLMASASAASTSPKTEGDKAYAQNDYNKAILIYESILKTGESADVYYNLGNCYYKTNEIAKSILNYERALLLHPYDSDIRHNLDIARSKTLDKVDAAPDIFFIAWINALINLLSVDRWAKLGIVFFILLLLSISTYVFVDKISIKKIGFIASVTFLLCTIFANLFAMKQKSGLVNRDNAIIMSHVVTVRSTPSDTGTKLFEIHEGHKVEISDNSMTDWKEIKLEDGKVGWLHKTDLEVI